MPPIITQIFQILGLVLATAFVLVLAWLFLRFMNKRLPGAYGGANRHIKVLDRVQVGKTGNILLLRVKDKVFLVAISEHAAEKIYEFDDPEGLMNPEKPGESMGFAQAMKEAARKLTSKEGKNGREAGEDGFAQQAGREEEDK